MLPPEHRTQYTCTGTLADSCRAEKLKENWRAVMATTENAEGGGADADGGKKRKRKATGGKGKGSKKVRTW
jgi:hypothetical protein